MKTKNKAKSKKAAAPAKASQWCAGYRPPARFALRRRAKASLRKWAERWSTQLSLRDVAAILDGEGAFVASPAGRERLARLTPF